MKDVPDTEQNGPALGQHVIAEFYGAVHLLDPVAAEDVLRAAAIAAGATVLQVSTHDFGDRAGFTGVALLAESHISIHTWPEHGFAAIDIFMCGDADPGRSVAVLADHFQPAHREVQVLRRGARLKVASTAGGEPNATKPHNAGTTDVPQA